MKSWICLTFALWIATATAQELIAHASNHIESLTRNEARLYMTMRLKRWPDETPVRIFVLEDDAPLHQRFVNSILGLYPYQLRRVWDRQIFTGIGQAPTLVSSPSELIERVAATPGALGYIDEGVSHQNIHTIKVH